MDGRHLLLMIVGMLGMLAYGLENDSSIRLAWLVIATVTLSLSAFFAVRAWRRGRGKRLR